MTGARLAFQGTSVSNKDSCCAFVFSVVILPFYAGCLTLAILPQLLTTKRAFVADS